jgi:23S rRNA pseudouridine2605 synthase
MAKMRINRALAAAGVASRRSAEDLVRAGRVRLNGQLVANLATWVDVDRDQLTLDNKPLRIKTDRYYYIYYKPRNIICTMKDERGRQCVGEICRPLTGHPRPAGRLDRDSEGLLLLTNDGELAHRLAHPRYGVKKQYQVSVEPALRDDDATQLVSGITLEDGPARALDVTLRQHTRERSILIVTVAEGRNRLVRRMLESLGYQVKRLKRLRLGTLALGRLKPGETRQLGGKEIRALRQQLGLD